MKRITRAAFAVFALFAFGLGTAFTQEVPTPQPRPDVGAHVIKFVNYQGPNERLASRFKGTDVVGSDNQKIGDVSDIMFDDDGNISAYIVGVGGFLGIGAKDIGITPDSFLIVPGDRSKNESDKLRLDATKEELKAASNFESFKMPRLVEAPTSPPKASVPVQPKKTHPWTNENTFGLAATMLLTFVLAAFLIGLPGARGWPVVAPAAVLSALAELAYVERIYKPGDDDFSGVIVLAATIIFTLIGGASGRGTKEEGGTVIGGLIGAAIGCLLSIFLQFT